VASLPSNGYVEPYPNPSHGGLYRMTNKGLEEVLNG
jgi:hypothetical protein